MSKLFTYQGIKKHQGMTLLEVMLALVILASAGIAVMQAASQSLSNQSYLQQKTFAMWVASNRLAELKLQQQWPELHWRREEVEFANTKWYLRFQGVATGNTDFRALDVEVSDQKDGQALGYIRTYIAKP
ncbi:MULTISPECIES: type II secretion system minor pseudopilin GspI [Psychromonas]|uniref:type II secretion system minor pseudopilin GspI n=1 Tax=Psychromonas TaxID=67572 RepID=UPI00040D9C37|nr:MULTISPECIES: type II secretion system minor pseudopilin GspI [Psychromonas]MBB1273867.1 type II secretion system minor pseudopilin GspI [Psychromonas sp. SR45-3]